MMARALCRFGGGLFQNGNPLAPFAQQHDEKRLQFVILQGVNRHGKGCIRGVMFHGFHFN